MAAMHFGIVTNASHFGLKGSKLIKMCWKNHLTLDILHRVNSF